MKQNPEINGVRTWIEVSRVALKHNYDVFRSLIGKNKKLMAIVKSNAYGHDIFQFSAEMEKLGADWLGVDSIVEGVALRKAGIRIPILVLGYTLPEKFGEAAAHDITLTISTLENLRALEKYQTPSVQYLKFHLKIDTGMHRQGFMLADLPAALSLLKAISYKLKANLTGLYTHFAAAKNPAFPKETMKQTGQFERAIKLVEKYFPDQAKKMIKHAAASSGTLLFPTTHYDLARVGISLYGLWPSAETEAALGDRIKLAPALTWKTIISETKKLKRGDKIGYDLTETLDRDTTIAVCPLGYWHGYSRTLSSVARVLVNGQRCRVLGRVSMDMITIDLGSSAKEKIGAVVTLLGTDKNETISAENLAALTDTTNYEIITRLNPLIRRVYR